jgi:hypothetical protein
MHYDKFLGKLSDDDLRKFVGANPSVLENLFEDWGRVKRYAIVIDHGGNPENPSSYFPAAIMLEDSLGGDWRKRSTLEG